MTKRILIVCLGNIGRSPAAEGVCRDLFKQAETDSAGTGGYHVGEPPYGTMQAAARARALDLSDLRAWQFEPQDFARFDLIVAMDGDNLRNVEAQRPADQITPVVLFTDFAAGSSADHVPDPYYTGEFDAVVELIEAAADGFLATLPQPK